MSENNHSQEIGALQEFAENSKADRAALHRDVDGLHEKLEKIDLKLDALKEELSVYKTIYKTVRFLFLCIVAIAAFKFGDVAALWHEFIGK